MGFMFVSLMVTSLLVYGKSFLSILVCLEIFVSLVFLVSCFVLVVDKHSLGVFLMVMFLAIAVGEAVLGLALLVSSSRLCVSKVCHPFSNLKF